MPAPAFNDHRAHIDHILAAVRAATDPRAATASAVRASPPTGARLAILAIGKAAPSMLAGFRDACATPHDAVLVIPDGTPAPPAPPAPPNAIIADHPLPTRRSLRASERVSDFVRASASGHTGHDAFVVLLSGGASSLLTWPAPDIDLDDYAQAMSDALRSGIDITALNTIRKHCERLKGGRLAAMMAPLPCHTYVLSDVIGDELSTVGSGPTLPDPTTYEDALRPFDRDLKSTAAERVLLPHLRDGALGKHPETPKPGDPRLARCTATLVGSNTLAISAAAAAASSLGFFTSTRAAVTGEASAIGRGLAAAILESTAPAALVWGGESTVTISPKPGKRRGHGGRNQELALAAAASLPAPLPASTPIAIATFATDGIDGPTNAAGAIITADTRPRAAALGLDLYEHLENHDSHTLLARLGDLIKTGPTGTNVNDVAIALHYP